MKTIKRDPLDVYQMVTDRIVTLLENGTIPWHKPWITNNIPAQNFRSKKPYRGVNRFLLHCSPFQSPYYLTYKQAKEMGGQVRRGEKGTFVVFWKIFTPKAQLAKPPAEQDKIPMLKYYNVFNLEQIDGIKAPATETLPEKPFTPIEAAQRLLADMPKAPTIMHNSQNAYYKPTTDSVHMPPETRFSSPPEYYSTLFHEIVHSTGHKSRLNRKSLAEYAPFGSAEYSKEELIAEIGASFLCNHCDILSHTIDNSAAYINGWLSKLKGDKKFIVTASAAAERAADFIKGINYDND